MYRTYKSCRAIHISSDAGFLPVSLQLLSFFLRSFVMGNAPNGITKQTGVFLKNLAGRLLKLNV